MRIDFFILLNRFGILIHHILLKNQIIFLLGLSIISRIYVIKNLFCMIYGAKSND